jgi:hypothetical protein
MTGSSISGPQPCHHLRDTTPTLLPYNRETPNCLTASQKSLPGKVSIRHPADAAPVPDNLKISRHDRLEGDCGIWAMGS